MRYLDEGGVQQLDGDYVPNRNSLSGSNYFERESQIMHFVSFIVKIYYSYKTPIAELIIKLLQSRDNYIILPS